MPQKNAGDKISPLRYILSPVGVKNSPLFLFSGVCHFLSRHGKGSAESAALHGTAEVGDGLLRVAFASGGGDDVGAGEDEVAGGILFSGEARNGHVDPHGHHLGKLYALHDEGGMALLVDGEGAGDVFLPKRGDVHVAYEGLRLQDYAQHEGEEECGCLFQN